MIEEEELARLEALASADTPGPWTWECDREMDLGDAAPYSVHTLYAGRTNGTHGLNLFGRLSLGIQGEADLAFAAESRLALPALLAEVRRLRAALSDVADACTRVGTSDRTDADAAFAIATMALEGA